MNEVLLDAVEINPSQSPRASIIWLHGLGADGHDFEPLIPELGIVEELAVRVVLPHAPRRPVSINGGMPMPAWYDICSLDFRDRQDAAGIRTSERQLRALIGRELANGVAPQHVFLAGFSQGGAIVLHTALRYPQRLGGALALSTYLPLADKLDAEASPANRSLPIMMAHGIQDSVVPLSLGVTSRDLLVSHGYGVDWYDYPMAHAVSAQEIMDIRSWLGNRLTGS